MRENSKIMDLYAAFKKKPTYTHQQSVRHITQKLPLKYLKYIKIIINFNLKDFSLTIAIAVELLNFCNLKCI